MLLAAEGGAPQAPAPPSASAPAREDRVGLQVGHWKNEELPDELRELRHQDGSRSPAGDREATVALAVARAVKERLERRGVAVDLLPATVPPGYVAAAVVSIHADWSSDSAASGVRVAPSVSDASGRARALAEMIARSYAAVTGLRRIRRLTTDMTRYYAFNARRFLHAVAARTPAAVLETGYLTNHDDRRVVIGQPSVAARGIAEGIRAFLDGAPPGDQPRGVRPGP